MTTRRDEKQQRPGIGSPYPWKSLLGGAAVVGGATTLGYISAGLATGGLARTPIGAYLSRLSPATKKTLAGGLVTAAATGGALAGGMRQAAMHAHLLDAHRKEIEDLRSKKEHAPTEKVAHVYDVYIEALEQL